MSNPEVFYSLVIDKNVPRIAYLPLKIWIFITKSCLLGIDEIIYPFHEEYSVYKVGIFVMINMMPTVKW